MRLLLPLFVGLASCTGPDVEPIVEPPPPGVAPSTCTPRVTDGEEFFARPFPDDARLVDGRANYEGFPKREITLVGKVLELAERQTGWSPYGTIYVPFDGPLDFELPDLAATLRPDSPIRLAPVDPADGEVVPVHARVFLDETSLLPANTLAIRPAWGRGLEPGVPYELTLAPEVGCNAAGEPVVLTITTAPVTDRLANLAAATRAIVPDGATFGEQWSDVGSPAENTQGWVGRLVIPRWQAGEVPYASEGGVIAFDGDEPVLNGFDEVPVAFVQPTGTPPPGGWPVMVHLNGTGSSFAFTYSWGAVVAQRGVAVVGIDLPLHGERGAGPTWQVVANLDNPASSVDNLLQGAVDQVWIAELLARDGAVVSLPDGDVPLDPTRIGYQGHSHGGIIGGLAAAHFDGRVSAAMLSGTGGGTFQGALFNESTGFDVPALVGVIFGFEDGEVLDDFHPIASLLQHAADEADPIYTAPKWFFEPGLQQHPLSAVLVTLGTADPFTPPLTTQAMAHAAQIPVLRGDYRIPADTLFPIADGALPASENVVAFDGTAVTAGVVQYEGGDHGVGLDDVDRWSDFVVSALVDGATEIP